jgi:hypothetical protein
MFPWVEEMYGDPIDDVFLGLFGALLAVLAYETAAMFLRQD